MSSLTTVLAGLVAIVALGGATALAGLRVHRHRPLVTGMHALRDDPARDPVSVPLRAGCAGLQIGVALDEAGRLQVGGPLARPDAGNAIGPLILRPLALRARQYGGRVRPDRRRTEPVTLMVEILETDPDRVVRAFRALDGALQNFPGMWTRLIDGVPLLGPVTVVLTGAAVPRQLVAALPERHMFCDGSFGDVGAWGAPVELVPVVSEHWSWRFGWDGTDEISTEERLMLRQYVAAAHADGRQVRIFGIPERSGRAREAFWRELVAAGVDVISTAKPRHLGRFLRHPAPIAVTGSAPGRTSPWIRSRQKAAVRG